MSDNEKKVKLPKPAPVRGMQDLLGEEAARFEHVVDRFRDVGRRFGFRPVMVPVVEHLSVFARTLGETTDVVSKEMYAFPDRGGDMLALRPEFTAGIARAYISEGWQQHGVLKLMTHGPLFRYERPQKGRYRQFHQVDAEVIGAAEPAADAWLIEFADKLLRELGIEGVTLQLNTLGDAETRMAWREALVNHFSRHRGDLSEDSERRLETNPLRILDSKEREDQMLVATAPVIDDYMSSGAGAFFEAVQKKLQASRVSFVRQPRLVRGFDYYRHTAFEFVTDQLGAQGTVIGGGRYDGLIEAMGGPATPAVGWAGGIERLMLLCEMPNGYSPDIVVVPDGDKLEAQDRYRLQEYADEVVRILQSADFSVDMAFKGNAGQRVKTAKTQNAASIMYVKIEGANMNLKLSCALGKEHVQGPRYLAVADRIFENRDRFGDATLEIVGSIF